MKKLLIVLLSACTWWACDKGDDGAPSSIVLTGGSGDQTIYADETSVNGGQGIAFEAAEAWYAEVSEVQAKASSGEVDWLTLSAYEGGAGQYTLQITLRANETGSDRAAEIRIVCGEDEIVIVVRQKAQTKDNQSVVVFEDEAFRQFCVEHFDADRNGMITDGEVSSAVGSLDGDRFAERHRGVRFVTEALLLRQQDRGVGFERQRGTDRLGMPL